MNLKDFASIPIKEQLLFEPVLKFVLDMHSFNSYKGTIVIGGG